MPNLRSRVNAAAAQVIFGLPLPIRRFIAGKPIRLDGQELALDAQLLLRLQKLSGVRLSAPTPALARKKLTESQDLVSGKPIEPIATRELVIPDDNGGMPATLYTPVGLAEGSGLLVFFHGGGWVIGTRRCHDNAARFLAKYADVRVLSVEYRLAPEHPFPAATDDALTAFDYAYANAKDLGIDPARIAVGGDSAGGNMSAVAAQQAKLRGGPAPAFQLLLYPAVDATKRSRSRELFSDGFFLTESDITWFLDHYAPPEVDRADPRLSPIVTNELTGLAPAYIATAGFDPLRDDGKAYADKLREAGVPVELSNHADLIHGYINFFGVGHRFREATAEAAAALKAGLA